MGYVSKEMAEQARQIHVLDYVMQNESSNIKRVGSSYRLKDHDSLAVSNKGFFWHSRGVGGVTALDYLMKVRGYDFVHAVCNILGVSPLEKGENLTYNTSSKKSIQNTTKTTLSFPPNTLSQNKSPPEKVSFNSQPLILPQRNKDNYQVIAYLQNRGIDKELIMNCINRGVLYESTLHHNAVFLGKDEKGKTRYATIRATTGDFKRDALGSNKQYGFVIPPQNQASVELAIFESPVDCLSHQNLCIKGDIPNFDGWRLSLGGTCIDALTHFLQRHPEIDHCLICTDNDQAGNTAAEKIAKDIYINTQRSPPPQGKDWNDMLKTVLQAECSQSRYLQNELLE